MAGRLIRMNGRSWKKKWKVERRGSWWGPFLRRGRRRIYDGGKTIERTRRVIGHRVAILEHAEADGDGERKSRGDGKGKETARESVCERERQRRKRRRKTRKAKQKWGSEIGAGADGLKRKWCEQEMQSRGKRWAFKQRKLYRETQIEHVHRRKKAGES